MKRRKFIKNICIAAGSAGVSLGMVLSKADGAKGQKPNIVLMMSDDQGWGETGYNGHPYLKTPVLDQMAAQGLRLDRFYAASPVCSPTRASCMTGRHANRSGAFGAGWSTRPEEVTVAQILKSAGYRTAHFGKWHIGAIKKGSPTSPNALGFDESLSHDNFFEMDSELSRNGEAPKPFKGDSSEFVVAEALKFAKKVQKEGNPFFIVIWFGSPHDPYSGYDKDIAPYKKLGKEISCRLAEITAMDRAVGTFRTGLDKMKVRKNTLLWFNSDNGITIEGIPQEQREHLYNGNLNGHKSQLYEGGLLVPAVIEWPNVITKHRISSVPCVTSDILPTLIDIVGVKHPKPDRPLDGISLKKLFIDGSMQKRPVPIGFWGYDNKKSEYKNDPWLKDNTLNQMITFTTRQKLRMAKGDNKRKTEFKNHRHPKEKPENFNKNAAWIDNQYKLYLPKSKKKKVSEPELYDLQNDREEQKNIASKHPEMVRKMKTQLLEWQKSVEKSLTGADY